MVSHVHRLSVAEKFSLKNQQAPSTRVLRREGARVEIPRSFCPSRFPATRSLLVFLASLGGVIPVHRFHARALGL